MTQPSEILYSAEHVSKKFPILGGFLKKEIAAIHAVSDVSLSIAKGETLALVGESGCGKSTLGRTLLRLTNPTEGRLVFRGQDITTCTGDSLRKTRRFMQMIFQDPYAALNPRMDVEQIIGEPLDIHRLTGSREKRTKRILELMDQCGLRADSLHRYPHEFSGGQRQRICIARALAVEPEFIICDEPVSALDVSIQAQILNLLKELQRSLGLTYLFISHDLRVVEHMADRVAVMYLGRIVETGPVAKIFHAAQHHYTHALLSAIPTVDFDSPAKRVLLPGDMPSPIHPPSGCAFHPRCSAARAGVCDIQRPLLENKNDGAPQQWVACHYEITQ